MIFSKFSLKRQVTTSMIFLIAIGFGLFALSQLKLDFFPDIQFPFAGVITSYSGAGPEDIENLISRPLEETLARVKNVKRVSSQSYKGASIVTVEFNYGTDMKKAEQDMRTAIDLVRDFLPNEASAPLVFVFDPSMTPIMFINLSSEYLGSAELRKLAEQKIEPLLERVDGVAAVQTQGGLKRQINIHLNPILMAQYGLSADKIAQAISFGGGLLPGGTIETNVSTYNLRIFSEYRSLEQIENTIVAQSGGQPIYVKDIATVEDGFKELSTEVRANYGQGILLTITKQSDANTVITCRKVKEVLPKIQDVLPEGTKFNIIFDQSDFILRSIGNLQSTALFSFILSFLVIYIFLRNLRSSLIMAISMPISIIVTFASLYAANLTLNIISMAGLALAVGMLVDNSIVALENIYRYRELGYNPIEAADKGVSEIGMAISASTLTTVAVFIPVLFVPNITGQLFKDMVLTISFSLVVSLFVALMLTPLLAANLLKLDSKSKLKAIKKFKDSIEIILVKSNNIYRNLLAKALTKKKLILSSTFILFIISLAVGSTLGGNFLPKSDRGFIQLVAEAPVNANIETFRKYALTLEEIIKNTIDKDLIETISITYGSREGFQAFNRSSNTIETFIKLKPVEQRTISSLELQDKLRKELDKIAGLKYYFQEGGFTGGSQYAIEVKIIGYDYKTAINIAREIKDKLEKTQGFVDITTNVKETAPELQIKLKKDILNSYGISPFQLANLISTSIQGKTIARYIEEGDEYDVFIQFSKEHRNKKEAIIQMPIPLFNGDVITLNSVADIVEEESTPNIFRENQSRFVSVGCNLSGIDLSTAKSKVEKIIKETSIPGDFQIIIGGNAEDQQDAFFYLGLAFLAAIVLVYMIMASQFESLVNPFIIMFSVPLSIIGVIFILKITGFTLDVMALVGIVMLVGIAVNNGIVLVDYTNQLREQGKELVEAIIEAGTTRFRPVLMTALTTILGMVPLALNIGSGAETWKPLATAVIGGLSFATVLTLFIIPILYNSFEIFGDKVKTMIKKII